MLFNLHFLTCLVSSVLAYTVITPSDVDGWTNQGPQPLVWQRVSTDQVDFAVVLVNQQISSFSPTVLGQAVNGTQGQTVCNVPSGGWPVGTGFQVNLVQSATALDAILAQSKPFNITRSTTTTITTNSESATPTATQAGNSSSHNAAISVAPISSGLLFAVFSFTSIVLY